MLALLISLVAAGAASAFGYVKSRQFVRSRLRYVDAVYRPGVPVIAAVGAVMAATPLVWVLPVVGSGTALLFGTAVGAGVAAGRREARSRLSAG